MYINSTLVDVTVIYDKNNMLNSQNTYFVYKGYGHINKRLLLLSKHTSLPLI